MIARSTPQRLIEFLSVAVLATGFVFWGYVGVAHAQADSAASVAESAGLADVDLFTLIGTIINVFLTVLGVIFLVLVLYAGYLWMTAAGSPEKVEKAKNILIRAAIGLVIILSAYGITSFIINALTGAGLGGAGGSGGSGSGGISVERFSNSLGSGAIRDHYPDRSATDIARNTRIYVTFKDEMDASTITTDTVFIYATADGEETALGAGDITIAYTEDLKTFTFDPPLLGSSSEDTNYTVRLDDSIKNADNEAILDSGGYEWTFTVGTEIDLDPPTIVSVAPADSGTYDRNIAVQLRFNEAVDPTSATGTRESGSGFDNITVAAADGTPIAGTYEISNGYKSVTFTSAEECGTNSCGETIYCLPALSDITVTVHGATVGTEPPQAESFPYDGVADTSANSFDGDGDWGASDGEAGDDYDWSFSTTDDINLTGPSIESIAPDIGAEDIDLDADVIITFDGIMMESTLTSDTVELTATPEHELWYTIRTTSLDSTGAEVTSTTQTAVQTQATVNHGVFLESSELLTYVYGLIITDGVRNEYQNCYSPAEGPSASGGTCGTSATSPYCCNGVAQSTACAF